MDPKERLKELLTTISTLSNYATESCHKWEPEDNSNFVGEAFFHVIYLMSEEAKGWAKIAHKS